MTNKVITDRIKEKIALNERDWADAYIAKQFNSQLTTPEAKKQVATAEHTMKEIEYRINFLKTFLKNETKKSR